MGMVAIIPAVLGALGSALKATRPYVAAEALKLYKIQRDIDYITHVLSSIRALLQHTQEQDVAAAPTQTWLRIIKILAYEIEDILDKLSTRALRRQAISVGEAVIFAPKKLYKDYEAVKKIKSIRKILNDIEETRKILGLVHPHATQPTPRPPPTVQPFPFEPYHPIIGREADTEALLKCLLEFHGTPRDVVQITGIGGVGKTTLARTVYKHPRITATFSPRIWVNMPANFDMSNLLRDILSRASRLNHSSLSHEQLVEELGRALRSKCFLIILDNIGNQFVEALSYLRHIFSSGLSRSRIIVTSRYDNLEGSLTGTRFDVRGLSNYHCLAVLAHYAGISDTENPDLMEVGAELAKKCAGNPLAAKTLGSSLRRTTDRHEWRERLNSPMWLLSEGPEGIMPALKLSYNATPHHLQACFGICALSRRGDPLFRAEIISTWMALGMVEPQNEYVDRESLGESYFDALYHHCFLQFPSFELASKVIKGYGDVIQQRSTSWQDLVRRFDNDDPNNVKMLLETFFRPEKLFFAELHEMMHDLATYVSQEDIFNVTPQRESIIWAGAIHITWSGRDVSSFPGKEEGVCRARSFSFTEPVGKVSQKFLKGLIESLGCLRILNLRFSDFEKLPDSVGGLKHLRYVALSWNSSLTALPKSITKLVNLQTLELFRCMGLDGLPKGLQKLLSLRFLYITCKMESLPKEMFLLKSLRVLKFAFCLNLRSLSDRIGELRNLQELEIICCDEIGSLPDEMNQLTNLERLSIFCCGKLNLEGWNGLEGMSALQILDLKELPGLRGIPDGAPSLIDLRVHSCQQLETLPERFGQRCTGLLTLDLSDCGLLSQIPPGIESLKRLSIYGCPILGSKCSRNGADWGLVSHIPRIIIDGQVI